MERRWDSRARWLANSAEAQGSLRDPVSEKKVERNLRRQPMLISDLHIQTWTYTPQISFKKFNVTPFNHIHVFCSARFQSTGKAWMFLCWVVEDHHRHGFQHGGMKLKANAHYIHCAYYANPHEISPWRRVKNDVELGFLVKEGWVSSASCRKIYLWVWWIAAQSGKVRLGTR